eukprot:scaffold1282_cov251-Pinguiococcus_pyrenoidosus.AAC.34
MLGARLACGSYLLSRSLGEFHALPSSLATLVKNAGWPHRAPGVVAVHDQGRDLEKGADVNVHRGDASPDQRQKPGAGRIGRRCRLCCTVRLRDRQEHGGQGDPVADGMRQAEDQLMALRIRLVGHDPHLPERLPHPKGPSGGAICEVRESLCRRRETKRNETKTKRRRRRNEDEAKTKRTGKKGKLKARPCAGETLLRTASSCCQRNELCAAPPCAHPAQRTCPTGVDGHAPSRNRQGPRGRSAGPDLEWTPSRGMESNCICGGVASRRAQWCCETSVTCPQWSGGSFSRSGGGDERAQNV